jgi:thermostable 8-oxoguanine DNA glycosylase
VNLLEDPTKFTNYHRTDAELELAWLFCLSVAGKTARVVAKQLETFLSLEGSGGPYQRLNAMIQSGTLLDNLKTARMGKYTLLVKGFTQSLNLNLRTATVDDLKAISGVGDKTSRYFLLHTREGLNIAVLDRHVVRFLREKGYDAPEEGTPNGKKYLELEQHFLNEAKEAKMTPADFDLMLWKKYSRVVTVK